MDIPVMTMFRGVLFSCGVFAVIPIEIPGLVCIEILGMFRGNDAKNDCPFCMLYHAVPAYGVSFPISMVLRYVPLIADVWFAFSWKRRGIFNVCLLLRLRLCVSERLFDLSSLC